MKRKKIIVNSFEKNKKRKTKNPFGYHFYFILFFVLKIKFLNSTFFTSKFLLLCCLLSTKILKN